MAKKFIITIKKDGTTLAEISGAKGTKCEDYLRLLESVIEGKVVSREYTQEYYQEEIRTDLSQNINNKIE